jgi:DNA repair protein RadA/Sms
MAAKTRFICSACGYESGKWYGRCPDCSSWNTFEEVTVEEPKKSKIINVSESKNPTVISKIKSLKHERLTSGFSELDRVLGGGIIPGSTVLLSGDPGVGKSTLLLELALSVSSKKQKVLYVTGEESEGQVKLRAERVGIKDNDFLFIFSTVDINQTLSACEKLKPSLVIVDSIQTMASEEFPGFAGSLPQLRHATSRLVSLAKTNNIPVFIIGHVTKEGVVAGPMLLSHMVDCVLYLEGSATGETGTRILRSFKNRFGDTSEVGIFSMEETGLSEISDMSKYFMDRRDQNVPGSCLTVLMEGSRPIIVEIQALVIPSNLAFARRITSGIVERRLELLLAVIQKHLKLPLDRMDVFVNVARGLKITETASDLALCLAVISSFKNKPLHSTVAVAEVGLLGELKDVLNSKIRIKEARKLGFKNIISADREKFLSGIIRNLF